jgi:uncharacterized protein (DUF1684 family)
MTEIAEFRQDKDQFFEKDHSAPLTHEQQESFSGLNYFDESDRLRFIIEPEIFEGRDIIEMQTSTGDVTSYQRWGTVSFDVDGESATLTLYRADHGDNFFLPFVDTTSGKETYGAGRYLDVEQTHDGKIVVDFNYAYNPYCAYNEKWSCPLTPFENRIQVPIRAGEKNFK